MKRTPLYDVHLKAGAKMIEFGGWEMPVQYTSVIDEHRATRCTAGLFDICHMGEFNIHGKGSLALLQKIMTRDLAAQKTNQMKLSVMTTREGGIIDDLTIYKYTEDRYTVVTNAATKDKDYEWIRNNNEVFSFNAVIEDVTEHTGKLDLQGPLASEILQALTDSNLSQLKYYNFLETKVLGAPATISRSGYTGEDGFEIYVASSQVAEIWEGMLAAGSPRGLKPAGLGARDTLRLEAGLMLYGNEMCENVTPLEVAYSWVLDLDKDFIGKDALLNEKTSGIKKKLVGFEMVDRGIARHGYKILENSNEIGEVTSGSFTPTVNKAIGMAFVPARFQEPGSELSVKIRENVAKAKVVSLPFYKRKK